MSTGLKKFALTQKNTSKVTPSLRLAFWSMILTSSLYWTIALLLGGALLSSCSGSIFGSAKKTPAPENSSQNPQAQVQNSSTNNEDIATNDNDGKPRDIGLVNKKDGKKRPAPLPDAEGRIVNEKASLEIFEILFPSIISEYSNDSRDQEKRNDVIAKLNLRILIKAPNRVQKDQKKKLGYEVRSVKFLLNDAKEEVLSELSADLKVTEDVSNGAQRTIMLTGFLQNKDEQKNIFFGLSFEFINNKFTRGQFIKYIGQKPKEIPMGDHRSLFKVSIQ